MSQFFAVLFQPERINPEPTNPDYGIRSDVWSLGITMVSWPLSIRDNKQVHDGNNETDTYCSEK